jgi:hypothetical protein
LGLVASLAGVAEARAKRAARRVGRRIAMLAAAALLALTAAGFGLAAGTLALAREIGTVPALLVVAGGALLVCLILLLVVAADGRKEARLAAQRPPIDREFASAAFRSAALTGVRARPSRGLVGLALVAIGALLVLRGRD